jgi:hypothetical protein
MCKLKKSWQPKRQRWGHSIGFDPLFQKIPTIAPKYNKLFIQKMHLKARGV